MSTFSEVNIMDVPVLRMVSLVLGIIFVICSVVSLLKQLFDKRGRSISFVDIVFFLCGGLFLFVGMWNQIQSESKDIISNTNTVAANNVVYDDLNTGHVLVDSDNSMIILIGCIMVIVLIAGISYGIMHHIICTKKEDKINE